MHSGPHYCPASQYSFLRNNNQRAFSAKALVNNSGLILFAAVSRNKTGPLTDINGFLPLDLTGSAEEERCWSK